jgi:glycosyltransferase involved in cell wall biosynthesis
VEEFGIAAVEAQAAGRPVIARRDGGALETVLDGVTGCFWSGGAADLARAVLTFDDAAIDSDACVANAARFDVASFRRDILAEVDAAFSAAGPRNGDGAVPAAGPRSAERRPLPAARLVRRAGRDARN